ncbi:MAG: 30S ribosomal protein S16 [Elusimicrobia bacterium]|nr:30S ribosomal protein S16 [Elusimicrobiota bacterium]
MSVRIRFNRVGRPHAPFYRLVAIDRQQARDAAPIEVLGTINPRNMKKPEAINVDRIKHWVSVGALASESVVHCLKVAGVWDQVKPGSSQTAKV